MGSYDNEPTAGPVSTPSWMRRTPAEGAIDQSPASPLAPSVAPSPSSNVATSRSEMLAPIPFHLTPFGTVPNNTGMAPFAPNIVPAPLSLAPLVPGVGVPPHHHPQAGPGAFGVNLMAPGFSQAGYMPPASAPPSLAPTATQAQHQDAIARILALQHANSSISQTTTPVSAYSSAPRHGNPADFSRNLPELTSGGISAPFSPPQQPSAQMVPNPVFPPPSVGNPFAAVSSTSNAMLVPNNTAGANPVAQMSIAPSNPFPPPGGPTLPSANGVNHDFSLDHLLPMQQAVQSTRQSMELFRPAQQPSSRSPAPTDAPLWQLQQQFIAGPGKPVQLIVSSDGSLKVANPPNNSADFLFEPSPAANRLKTSGKNLPPPRTSPIYAHHNYGVPAQP